MVAEVDLSGDDPGPWAAKQYTAMINTLGDEEEYASAMLCGLDMLTSGFTFVMDPGSTFEPDTVAQASQALGFRVSLADPWIMDTKGPQITDVKRAKFEREAALAGLGHDMAGLGRAASRLSIHTPDTKPQKADLSGSRRSR